MKKMLIALTAAVLVLTLLCGGALAATGDLTTKSVKAYSNAARTEYVGTIPAYTALVVRSYDDYADVYINGKVYYIDASALLHKEVSTNFSAILEKGTKVYQNPTSSANTYTVKSACFVKLCAVNDDWALVQATNKEGYYGFVKVNKLINIIANN